MHIKKKTLGLKRKINIEARPQIQESSHPLRQMLTSWKTVPTEWMRPGDDRDSAQQRRMYSEKKRRSYAQRPPDLDTVEILYRYSC